MTTEDLINVDIAVADWLVREISREGWNESIYPIKDVDTAKTTASDYATVTRTYLPDWNIEDLYETRVSVVPNARATVHFSREAMSGNVLTDVLILKRSLLTTLNATADRVMELSQQIETWMETNRRETVGCRDGQLELVFMNVERPEVYNMAVINKNHVVAVQMQFRTTFNKVPVPCG